MLVLKRKEGQWVDVIHRSGDILRLRVYEIQQGAPSRANIAFDDPERNFEIRRPERRVPSSDPQLIGDSSLNQGSPDRLINPLTSKMS